MNITVCFRPANLAELSSLRREYLSELRCAQELMLEMTLPTCDGYWIDWREERIGYLIVKPAGELVEFHLRRAFWLYGQTVIGQAIRALQLSHALVKSYDDLMLSSTIEHQREVSVVGLLVRDYVPRSLPETTRVRYDVRVAVLQDLPAIVAIEQDVFAHPERLRRVISAGWMLLFQQPSPDPSTQASLIGFGILRPITLDSEYADVGIAVDRPFRNKGYAIYMMRDLVERCRARKLVPIAGCSSDNLASRRMGERIGLVARHRLLRLTFRSPGAGR